MKEMQRAEIEELLTKAKELLRPELNQIAFTTWIQPIQINSIEDTTITLYVPSDVHKNMIEGRYLPLIQTTFAFLTNINYTILITCHATDPNSDLQNSTNSMNMQNRPLGNLYNKSNLNPKYTFDSFVVGENNRFAHAAALAVSEAPGTAYNPLFLYGGVGLGKTHLMHSIGNEILKHNPNASILYVTSEQFNNHLIAGIKEGKMENFRAKYRNTDVLLIDDIQFLAGRKSNQEEFFHTFNELHSAGKQIILSSDRPPRDIQPLEDRLRTRFEWGLIADISNPDYETRMAILQKKVQLDGLIIDNDILSNIATKIDTNIRELEGVLNKLVATSKLKNQPFSIALSEEAIADVVSHKNRVLSIDYIQEVVSKYFDVTLDDLKGSRRSSDVVFPRQVAMYLCKNVAQISFPKIGQAFGKRDHSTVMHACEKIEKEMKENANTKLIVETVKNSLFSDNDT